MHRFNIAVLALWLALAPAFAQMNSFFPGPGTIHTTGGAAFQGPGDIVSGSSAYWGLICYNTAYTGKVADLVDAATGNTTGTRLQCAAGGTISALVSGSACTFVTGNACSSIAITCATACSILTFYDQSGSANCGSTVACDMTQATLADQATFTQNCNGTKFCATSNTNTTYSVAIPVATINQPYSVSAIYKRTVTSGTQLLFYAGSNNIQLAGNGAGAGYITASGTNLAYTATDNAYHSVQGIFTTTCTAYTDGSVSATPAACGTATPSGFANMGISSSGLSWVGTFYSVGLWPAAFTSGNASSMSTNDHTNCGC